MFDIYDTKQIIVNVMGIILILLLLPIIIIITPLFISLFILSNNINDKAMMGISIIVGVLFTIFVYFKAYIFILILYLAVIIVSIFLNKLIENLNV